MRSQRVSLFIMAALACALLLLGKAEAYVFDEARDTVSEATAPILEVFSMPVTVVRAWIEDFTHLLSVYRENERLRAEVEELRQWKDAALEMRQTTARYEALLNVQVDPGIGYVTGRVIGESGGPFVHTYIVNVGRSHGVEKGQAVVDTRGLVGRILGVGENASRVLVINDLNSRIPVVIHPSNERAILAGDNNAMPKLAFLPEDVALNDGDRVETSGHDGLLPRGLPVGTVLYDERAEEYRVQPFSRASGIDFVRVLQFRFPRMDDQKTPSLADGHEGKRGDAALAGVRILRDAGVR